jgi:hypothetical protein
MHPQTTPAAPELEIEHPGNRDKPGFVVEQFVSRQILGWRMGEGLDFFSNSGGCLRIER